MGLRADPTAAARSGTGEEPDRQGEVMTEQTSTEREKSAPAPDDERKPDNLTDLNRRSWKFILRKTIREFSADQCLDLAAALTYYAVLALFPAVLALVSLLGLIGRDEQGTSALMTISKDFAPGAADTVASVVTQLTQSHPEGLAVVLDSQGRCGPPRDT